MKDTLWNLLRDENCTRCPLHKGAQSVCLIGDGKYPADLMLVGEAPGYREDSLKKPFAGRAGKLLDSVLETLEIRRNNLFISNAVHCRPVDPIDPRENKKPKDSEIRICSTTFLKKEVRYVKPKLLLALGQVAAQALLQKKLSVVGSRNRVHYTSEPFLPNIPVIVAYHPAAVLRKDYLLKPFVEDFEWALRILKDGVEEEADREYIQVDSVQRIPGLDRTKRISIDLETDGLDCYLPGRDIISVQLCTEPSKAYYLRWDERIKEEIKAIAENTEVTKVGHNLNKYDRNWLRKKGIILRGPIRDTLIEAHLIDENAPSKKLDDLASAHTSLKNHKNEMQEYVRKNKVSWRDVPLDIAIPYGCGDVDAALRLDTKWTKEIKREGLRPLFRLQMRAMKTAAAMEFSGIKVNVGLFDELADIYEKKVRIKQRKLTKLIGQEVNPNSHVQVGKILYEQWGLPAVGDPKKWGQPPVKNTAEKTLLKLTENHCDEHQGLFIETILQLRETRKLLSTYVLGMGDFIRPGDLIHPSYKLHGTVTGRWSSVDPNMQNIPRDGEIKRLFISRYGSRGALLQVDLSQAELRFGAHLSQEPTLLEYFRSGNIDIHTKVAARIYKISEEEVTKEQRKKTKTVNFGILYGGSANKMASEMKCSVAEAQEFINVWLQEFHHWPEYVRMMKRRVIKDGHVRNPFGRIRHLPIVDPSSEQGKESIRQAVNSPIQGGVSDYTVHCGCSLYRRVKKRMELKDFHLVAEVHDMWMIDTLKEYVDDLIPVIKEEFVNPDLSEYGFEMTCPMDIEIAQGDNWKEVETIYPEAVNG